MFGSPLFAVFRKVHKTACRRKVLNELWQFSPFGHPRINAHQATPRGLTQPITSFIGLAYPGIHHAPKKQKTHTFITHRQQKIPRTKPQKRKTNNNHSLLFFYRIRVHYTVLTQHTTPHTTPNKRPCLPGVIHRTTLVLL